MPLNGQAVAGSLVWVRGFKGPCPQKWPHDAPAGVKLGKTVLAEHKLGASEYSLSLAILEQRYPAPKVET